MNNTQRYLGLFFRALLLASLGIFFPVLYIFFPYHFVVESLEEGIVKIMSLFLGLCLLMGVLVGPIVGISILTLFGPLILIFHYMISARMSVNATILATTAVFLISMVLALYTGGVTPESLSSPESLDNFLKIFKNIGDASLGTKAQFIEIYNAAIRQLPGVLIITALCVSYYTFKLTGRAMLMSGRVIDQPEPLRLITFSRGILVALGILLLIPLLGIDTGKFQAPLENLRLLFLFFVIAQGIGVLSYFLTAKRIVGFAYTIIMVVFIFVPVLNLALIVMGAGDMIFDFRKLRRGGV